jgi:hypothetical protein
MVALIFTLAVEDAIVPFGRGYNEVACLRKRKSARQVFRVKGTRTFCKILSVIYAMR